MKFSFWGRILPVTALATILAMVLARWGIHPHGDPATALVLPWAREFCFAEPTEQAQFLAAILIPPILIWLMSRRLTPSSDRQARVAQACVLLFVIAQLALQNISVHVYVGAWHWARILVLAAALAWLRPDLKLRKLNGNFRPLGIAAIGSALFLLSTIFREQYLSLTAAGIRYHMPYTLGEFAAVLNGRTPRFDYFPLYTGLLSYLALPVFWAFGISFTSFTLTMALFNFVGLLAVFWIFKKLTRNAWLGLALFLAYLGLAFYPIQDWMGQRNSAFTYFPNSPVRSLPHWLTLAALVWSLARPSLKRMALVIAVGTLALFNNIEFGGPTLAGALAALMLLEGRKALHACVIAFPVTLAAIFFAGFARSGALPPLLETWNILKSYGVAGFYNMPMPIWGWHWLVYLSFLSALVMALVAPLEDRMTRGVLAYIGAYGLLSLAYYQGRSDWEVLIGYFGPWAFCLMTLLHAVMCLKPSVRTKLPTAVLVVAYALCLTWLIKIPSPLAQWRRLHAEAPLYHPTSSEASEFVRSHSSAGEPIAVIYPSGFMIAELAGRQNVYPFTQGDSLVLKSQLTIAVDALEKRKVKRIFGQFPTELSQALTAHGYRYVEELLHFAYWQKD